MWYISFLGLIERLISKKFPLSRLGAVFSGSIISKSGLCALFGIGGHLSAEWSNVKSTGEGPLSFALFWYVLVPFFPELVSWSIGPGFTWSWSFEPIIAFLQRFVLFGPRDSWSIVHEHTWSRTLSLWSLFTLPGKGFSFRLKGGLWWLLHFDVFWPLSPCTCTRFTSTCTAGGYYSWFLPQMRSWLIL